MRRPFDVLIAAAADCLVRYANQKRRCASQRLDRRSGVYVGAADVGGLWTPGSAESSAPSAAEYGTSRSAPAEKTSRTIAAGVLLVGMSLAEQTSQEPVQPPLHVQTDLVGVPFPFGADLVRFPISSHQMWFTSWFRHRRKAGRAV